MLECLVVRRALTAVLKCLPGQRLMLAVAAASLGWPLAGSAAAGHCPAEALELAAQSQRTYLDCNHYPDTNRCRAAGQMAARATAVGPQCGVAWTVLARQWIDAGRRDDAHTQKARDYAARALQFAPDDPEALRVVGRIHYLDRQYAQARERFDQAARSGLSPRLATNYAELAQAVSANAGQLLLAPEAKTWYERAIEVSVARGATRREFDPDARLAMNAALFALGRDAA
ncbi:hypothetical protein IP84_10380 [beta proteobacterium AAP99]|nr:hypothetical protein IP84_10380 [beta proteobacterium AAP99]